MNSKRYDANKSDVFMIYTLYVLLPTRVIFPQTCQFPKCVRNIQYSKNVSDFITPKGVRKLLFAKTRKWHSTYTRYRVSYLKFNWARLLLFISTIAERTSPRLPRLYCRFQYKTKEIQRDSRNTKKSAKF